jgi:hypothetical protein
MRMSLVRRAVVFALVVAAFVALMTIHLSKGEPLRTPPSTVTVRPTRSPLNICTVHTPPVCIVRKLR